MDGGESELLAAAPFGPRGLELAARAPLSGVQLGALDPERALVTCSAAALGEEELAALAHHGLLPERERPGRLCIRSAVTLLAAAAERAPGLVALLAAHRHATTPPAAARLMGVVNVTPDSFSDGGAFSEPTAAIQHGLRLVEAGAALLDVGGESTRPGSRGVGVDEELARVLPVVEGLAQRTDVPLSIDTTKSRVAAEALAAGASLVNDVSAGSQDPDLLPLVAERGAGLVLMHMHGTPATMQQDPHYEDVVAAVVEHLRARVAAAWRAGVALPKIQVDPGIGFGKRLEDNLALIRALPELRSLGRPIVLGVSRKSFLGTLGGIERPAERLTDTAAAVTAGVLLGAEVLRVHDVRGIAPALRVAAAISR